MERVIICVDMDAFFASVEQKTNPALRGRPVAVIGSGKRTIVTTASYEARALGVKTGMNVYEARRACPGLIFVVGDNRKYTHTSRALSGIYGRFTPEVETYSVDEAFLDITTTHHLFEGPEAVGRSIKEAVRGAFGINSTVGIGPNILIAKLASTLAKPDGLMRVKRCEVEGLLRDLPVDELWGIGRKTAERLAALGIRTCGELGRAPAGLLRSRFGMPGEALKEMGMGIFERPVSVGPDEPKSIGHSMTLPRDISEKREIEAYVLMLSEMVGRRARRHGLMGKKLSLTVRYPDFETFSRGSALGAPTDDTRRIYGGAMEILEGIRLRDRVRLLGVCLFELVEEAGQIPLIVEERKRRALLRAVDSVNDRFGEFKIMWASYAPTGRKGAGVISPSWRPSGAKNVDVR